MADLFKPLHDLFFFVSELENSIALRESQYVWSWFEVAHVVSIEGAHMGEIMGMPATGRPFHLAVVFLYELRDHKIVRERRIYDFTGLLLQIGVLKAKPV